MKNLKLILIAALGLLGVSCGNKSAENVPAADRPQHRRVERHTKKKNDIIVQDLHIAELRADLSRLPARNVLSCNRSACRKSTPTEALV